MDFHDFFTQMTRHWLKTVFSLPYKTTERGKKFPFFINFSKNIFCGCSLVKTAKSALCFSSLFIH